MMITSTSLEEIQQRIHAATERSIAKDVVKILGVTKKHSIEKIKEAVDVGLCVFGENYVQEAEAKAHSFPHCQWHFIGTIQSNKCAKIVELFDVVQTVCREKDVLLLEQEAAVQRRKLVVYIQYDPGVEETKHGANEREVGVLADLIGAQSSLVLGGVMMMAPNVSVEERRPYFRKARALFDVLRVNYPQCTTLSMGMSDDFEVAVEEGSTMVRLGTALFGPRSY